jgi:hypothetical protein
LCGAVAIALPKQLCPVVMLGWTAPDGIDVPE